MGRFYEIVKMSLFHRHHDHDKSQLQLIVNKIQERLNQIMAALADLDAEIAKLKAQLDAITPPPVADFTPQITAVQAIETDLAAKFPPPPGP